MTPSSAFSSQVDATISGVSGGDDNVSSRKRRRLDTHQLCSLGGDQGSQEGGGNINKGGDGKVAAAQPRRPRVIWRPGTRQTLQPRHPFDEKAYMCNLCCKVPKTAKELQWHMHSWDLHWAHMRPQQRWKPHRAPNAPTSSSPRAAEKKKIKVGALVEFSAGKRDQEQQPKFMSNQSQCNCLVEFPTNQATGGHLQASNQEPSIYANLRKKNLKGREVPLI